jgi:TolB-like protein
MVRIGIACALVAAGPAPVNYTRVVTPDLAQDLHVFVPPEVPVAGPMDLTGAHARIVSQLPALVRAALLKAGFVAAAKAGEADLVGALRVHASGGAFGMDGFRATLAAQSAGEAVDSVDVRCDDCSAEPEQLKKVADLLVVKLLASEKVAAFAGTPAERRPKKPPPPPLLAKPPAQAQTLAQGTAAAEQHRGRTPVIAAGKLAVLDFKNYTRDLKPEDVRYFTDVVRGATIRVAPRMEVMTRENLLVLLQAAGKNPSDCEGECEVETGRRVGADAVVSGDVLKVGTRYKMSLRLHETHDGRLLSTAVASGKSIDELDESVQQAAQDLLAPPR